MNHQNARLPSRPRHNPPTPRQDDLSFLHRIVADAVSRMTPVEDDLRGTQSTSTSTWRASRA